MALALAVQHWCSYLLGKQFKVFSDQKILRYLLQQRISTPDQQNWVAKLLGYNFEICYRPSKENQAVDALSRREEGAYNSLVSFPTWEEGYQLLQEANQDPVLQKIRTDLLKDPSSQPGFILQNGILYHKGQLVISSISRRPLRLAPFTTMIGTTPFEAVYGKKPPTIVQHILGQVNIEVVSRELKGKDEALKHIKLHLTRAQEHMKRTTNAHRRDVTFEVGNWVYLKLRPHRQQSVVQRFNQKFAPHYYGLFILRKRLDLWHID